MMIYVDCACNDCGFAWSTEVFSGRCPECGSTNINQRTVIGNNVKTKIKDNMMPYIY